MVSPQNPTKYLGPNVYLAPTVTRDRAPTLADYRQPETGKLYPIFTSWQVGKNPTVGAEGDLWLLSKIIANQGYWVKIGTGSSSDGPVLSISGDANVPVFPTAAGNIQLLGTAGQITIIEDTVNNKLVFALVGSPSGITNVLTANATPQFALVGPVATVDFKLTNLVLGSSLPSLTTGRTSAGFGYNALNAYTSGQETAAFGYTALQNMTTGTGNTGFGFGALKNVVTGNYNIALGDNAGTSFASNESSNISIGAPGIVNESNAIRIGVQGSGFGQQNTCYIQGIATVVVPNTQMVTIDTATGQLGSQAITSGTVTNVLTANATPQFTGGATKTVDFGITNLVLGSSLPAFVSGFRNVGLGQTALNGLTNGSNNTAIGFESGKLLNSSTNNTALGTYSLFAANGAAVQNVAIGMLALPTVTTGQRNVGVGYNALSGITTGSDNIGLGDAAGSSLSATNSSNILIGSFGVSGDNNTLRIGDQGSLAGEIDKTFVAGIVGVTTSNSEMVTIDTTTGQLGSVVLPLQTVQRTLTSTEIKNLNATPIALIPAQGAGKVIILESAVAKFIYGGTNVFVAAAVQTIDLFYGITLPVSSNNLVTNAMIIDNASSYTIAPTILTSNDVATATVENVAINAYNSVATEISGNAADDNTITIVLKYYVVTI